MLFFFFEQKTAYEMLRSLVGSEMFIRDSAVTVPRSVVNRMVMPSQCTAAPPLDVAAAARSAIGIPCIATEAVIAGPPTSADLRPLVLGLALIPI